MAQGTVIDGSWLMRPVAEFSEVWLNDGVNDGWSNQELPGHWQQVQGLENYEGKMVYKKTFQFIPKPDRVFRLCLKGVFYRYRVFLNRFYLGDGEGYFVPAIFDITSVLKSGENTLLIEVYSVNEPERCAKTRFMGAYNGWTGLAPEINPGGIWQPVEILDSGQIFLQSWNLWTEEVSLEEARLGLRVNLDARVQAGIRLLLSLLPEGAEDESEARQWEWSLETEPQISTWETTVTIEKPRLWWSWDLGQPSLYHARLKLIDMNGMVMDQNELIMGIRRFELRNYIPYLNGRRFLAKGANYAPGDLYPAAMTANRYSEDLKRAQAIHINMLRVYSHVEADEFYEEADRAGMLLWQDTALYGRYRTLVKKQALRQTQGMVMRLDGHPSVVVWSMHEEPSGHLEHRLEAHGLRKAWEIIRPLLFSWNRDRLDRALKAAVLSWDRTRPVIANTGTRGWMMDCGGHLTYGWLPGHGPKRRFEFIRHGIGRRRLRFVTQMGGESFLPDHDTFHFSAAAGEALNWDRQALKRSRSALNSEHKTVHDDSSDMHSRDVYGQESQAQLLQYFVDRLRYHKYRPTGGILGTFLHAPYPATHRSLLTYERVPTPAYTLLALAYRPLYVFALMDKDTYYRGETVEAPIYLACDLQEIKNAVEIKARLTGPSGDLVWKGRWVLTPNPDMETLEIARASALLTRAGDYRLHLSWHDGELVENIYYIKVKGFRHHQASLA